MASGIGGIRDELVFDGGRRAVLEGDVAREHAGGAGAGEVGGLSDVDAVGEAPEDAGHHVDGRIGIDLGGVVKLDDTRSTFYEFELRGESGILADVHLRDRHDGDTALGSVGVALEVGERGPFFDGDRRVHEVLDIHRVGEGAICNEPCVCPFLDHRVRDDALDAVVRNETETEMNGIL